MTTATLQERRAAFDDLWTRAGSNDPQGLDALVDQLFARFAFDDPSLWRYVDGFGTVDVRSWTFLSRFYLEV